MRSLIPFRASLRSRLGRRGATAVEFALTLPILVVILGGIIEYGWYIQSLTSVVHAAREGARYGVTFDVDEDPETEAEAHARSALAGLGIDCDGAAVCTISANTDTSGSVGVLVLDITVQYDAIAGMVPTPGDLTGRYSMALEDQAGLDDTGT